MGHAALCYQKPDQQTGFWFCSHFHSCSDCCLYTGKRSPDQKLGSGGRSMRYHRSRDALLCCLTPIMHIYMAWLLEVFLQHSMVLLFPWDFLLHWFLWYPPFWWSGSSFCWAFLIWARISCFSIIWSCVCASYVILCTVQCTPLAFSPMGPLWPLVDINI